MILRSASEPGLLRINRRFEEKFGLEPSELVTRPLLQWIHPDDRPELAACIDNGEGTVTARHATTSEAWIAVDWKIRTSSDGTVALGLCAERDKNSANPLETETRGSTITDTLHAMARIVERKNPGLRCSILLTENGLITGGAGPSLPDSYNAAVEGLEIGPFVGSCGTASFWNTPVIVEDIHTDPLWRDLRDAAALAGVGACWSHPITSTDGVVLGAMALYADEPRAPTQSHMDGLEIAAHMVGLAIQRDRLEEQLREAVKMEALGVLAGGIAHDFNNMLATVLGNAEMAKSTLPRDAEACGMLDEIVTASISASELCNQMLAYAGRSSRSTESFDFNELVEEIGGLLNVTLSKKARIIYDLASAPLGVVADRSQLRQVMLNLVTNAAEAIGEDTGQILVRTTIKELTSDESESLYSNANLQLGEFVHVLVRDSGSGMSAETLTKIFDPFFSTKPTGRGLGLAAVKGIIKSHGGGITLESELGRGTTFSVLLPYVPLPEGHGRPTGEPELVSSNGALILVVDDEPQVLDVHSRILEQAGYHILRARDGQDAIDVFRTHAEEIDGVLLDLSMPKLGGDEVFRMMRTIREDVPVVLSSGFTEQEMLDRFRGDGLAGAVQKPVQMKVLLTRVAAALRTTAMGNG